MAMSEAEILAAVGEIVHRELGFAAPVSLDMRLLEDLELDSVGRLTLAVAVENRFRVILEPEDEAAVVTVGDLVRALARKMSAGQAE